MLTKRNSSILLVDVEGACINCIKDIFSYDSLRRSNTPISEMRTGKFRKLFDRHALAFKH